MKLKELPSLCKALEYLAASDDTRVREDITDQRVPPSREDEFRSAEECAQELDGHAISAFLDAESIGRNVNIDQDALEFVAIDNCLDAERLVSLFGDAGEALENILDDAAEGDLKVLVFGEADA